MAPLRLAFSLAAALCLTVCASALITSPSASAPFMLGSGLSLQFQARPQKPYCLLSDPCLHVNALMDSVPARGASGPLSWVQGVGIRSRKHTLILRARGLSSSPLPADADAVTHQRRDAVALAMLDYTDVRGALRTGKNVSSEDGDLSVGVVEEGRLYLVTLAECGVRLMVRLRMLTSVRSLSVPHFLVDTLDWPNLDAPHGIIGQIFPNHARPDQWEQDLLAPPSPTKRARPAGAGRSQDLSVKDALEQLRALPVPPTVLDGLPDDYLSSDILASDCLVSRFASPSPAGAHEPRKDPQGEAEEREDGEGEEDAEGEVSPHTLEHAARSAGQVPRAAGRIATAQQAAATRPRLELLRGSKSMPGSRVSSSRSLTPEDVQVIASMQGTQEPEESPRAAAADAAARRSSSPHAFRTEEVLHLTPSELRVISSAHGTEETAGANQKAKKPLAAGSASSVEELSTRLSEAELNIISRTQGTSENVAGARGSRDWQTESGVKALAQSDLQALSSMQGTSNAAKVEHDSQRVAGSKLSREEALLIVATHGTTEAVDRRDDPAGTKAGTKETSGDSIMTHDTLKISTHGAGKAAAVGDVDAKKLPRREVQPQVLVEGGSMDSPEWQSIAEMQGTQH